ncbi:MAG TPA: DJ-1/PfpI family protein [Myxococcales bacterium]|jgi:putative intracellular protease/amidase
MKILFLLFDGLTALDAVGPYEVLARLPGAEVKFVGKTAGAIVTGDQRLRLGTDLALEDATSCDLLVVPGGFGTRALERDERVLDWVRKVDQTTSLTASVCTGSFVLAAAGLLKGRRATSHWAVRERLAEYGALPVGERMVRDGKYATAAGVSAGIDLALALAVELCGREVAASIQLSIEYDPAPPLDAGSPDKAPKLLRDTLYERYQAKDRAARS